MLRIVPMTLVATLVSILLAPRVQADEWNKKTVATFDQDVQIPGQVLPQGTYVFKLFNSDGNRDVVQVWDESETQLIATLQTVGNESPSDSDQPSFVLDTSDPSSPPTIVTWYFSGGNTGRDFIYPSYPPQQSPQYQPA